MGTNVASLATKYRPQTFNEVIGQETTIKSLKTLLSQKEIPKAYLFIGSPGLGKSTLCRIIAKEIGCDDNNIIEIDAAVYSGVETLRELIDSLRYGAIGEKSTKFIVIEEAHSFSKASWACLLRIMEEPPPHVYFALSTTEGNKVPEAIKTQRCITYVLKEVRSSEIALLLDNVCKLENIQLPKGGTDIIAKGAGGSPRRALTYLSQCRGCLSLDEIRKTMETYTEDNYIDEIAKIVARGSIADWSKVVSAIKGMKEEGEGVNAEGIRINIVNYLTACVLNAKSSEESLVYLDKMSNFLRPLTSTTGVSELLVSIGASIL